MLIQANQMKNFEFITISWPRIISSDFDQEQVLLNAAQVALQLAQFITHTSIPIMQKIIMQKNIIYNFSVGTFLLVSGPIVLFLHYF